MSINTEISPQFFGLGKGPRDISILTVHLKAISKSIIQIRRDFTDIVT